jgi:hypothetical protein
MGDEEMMLRFLRHACNDGRYVLEGRNDDEAMVIMKTESGLQPFPQIANALGWHTANRRNLNEEERERIFSD